MKTLLIVSSIILINNLIDAMKLKFVVVKDMPLEDCDKYPPETSLHNFFDISNLSFKRIEEDVILANGDIIYKDGLFDHENPTEATVQLYIYQFGNWLPTPYSSFFEDICKTAFGPDANENWKNVLNNVKGRKRCPFEAGDKFSLNHTLKDDCFDIPIMRNVNDFDGLYKTVVTINNNSKEKPALLCFQPTFQIQNC